MSKKFIKRTIELAKENVKAGGQPFACMIVNDKGEVVVEACNLVAQTKDATAHAEIVAIREACTKLGTPHLTDCEFIIMAHPCPMCLTAMYYCSPKKVTFINTRESYSAYYSEERKYYKTSNIYEEVSKPRQERRMPIVEESDPEGLEPYRLWSEMNGTAVQK